MPTPFRSGPEFLVNTTTDSLQELSSITALADGRFVVAWRDSSATALDTLGTAIRAQVFGADGTRSGAEFVVNSTTANDQSEPSIAALADGGFVVAWTDSSGALPDTSGSAIRAQVFAADGTRSGAEFVVNSTTSSFQYTPTITALADGRFAVAWVDSSATAPDTSNTAIRAQVFEADGTRSGAEFVVNSTTANNQYDPAITALADGSFVVAWQDNSGTAPDTSQSAIRAQVFGADGSRTGAEFLVNSTTASYQFSPSITWLADGRFAVAWEDYSATPPDTWVTAIRAQVFEVDGTRSGAEFVVNTTTSSAQDSPTITALADGRFVVAWADDSRTGADTSFSAIRAQVFDADGTRSGAEFVVNSTFVYTQFQPTITALADGRFAVAWTDYSATLPDTSGSAIRGQIFDPRVAAVSLNGSLLADSFVGTLFGDTMAGSYGNDSIKGMAGEDLLSGEAGNDRLAGGAGNDRIFGGDGDDRLLGDAGSDQLSGGAGNDTLNGGAGADALTGGAGNDVYTVDSAGDLVFEAAGEGTDRVESATRSLNLASYANVENAALTGSLALNLTGDALANALTGNEGANRLDGGGGNDRLDGGLGNDTLTGGLGNDVFVVNASGDRVSEAAGGGTDRVDSATISLNLTLAAFANVENAALTGSAALNLTGTAGANALTGNAGANILTGGAGNDTLSGGAGNDTLSGGDGNDRLTGGLGQDRLTGGAGADVFVFAAAGETGIGGLRDTITDFQHGVDDISLRGLVTGGTFIGGAGFSGVAGQVRYSLGVISGDADGDLVVDFQIAVTGSPLLSAGDFLF